MADSSQDSPVNQSDAGGDNAASSSTPPPPQDEGKWSQEQINTVFSFVNLVRDTIKDRPKLRNFFQVFDDIKDKRLSKVEVCERARVSLKDHPNLLPGLSAFLLTMLNTSPSGEKKAKEKAQRFLEKVEILLQNKKETYNKFFKLMEDFGRSQISLVEVVEGVDNLFDGNEDLMKEFTNFIMADNSNNP